MAKAGAVKDVGNYRFFIFSSRPKAVNVTSSPLCLPGALSRKAKGRRYANIMWDPRVCRGVYIPATGTNGECSDLPQKMTFRKPAEETTRTYSTIISTKGPILKHSVKRSRSSITVDEIKVKPSRPMTPPPVEGREHLMLQTDEYFESFEDDELPGDTIACQTETYYDIPQMPPLLPFPKYPVEEKGTQCSAWEIIDIDEAVRPVSQNIANAIISRALIEIMDEHELHSLMVQQNMYLQTLHQEQLRLEIARKNIKIAAERNEIAKERERCRKEHEAHILLNIINFSCNYLMDFTEKNRVEVEHVFLDEEARDPIKHNFQAWENEGVGKKLKIHTVSRQIADDIIRRVVHCDDDDPLCRQPKLIAPSNSAVSLEHVVKNVGQAQPSFEYAGEYTADDEDEEDEELNGPPDVEALWNTSKNSFDAQGKMSVAFTE